jgi:DNA-binding LytR/AlgR family response regulator
MLKLRNIRKSSASGITIHSGNMAYSFGFNEIIYITAHLKHIAIHTGENDIEVPILLKEVIDRLPDIFIRIHKSHIININYIHTTCSTCCQAGTACGSGIPTIPSSGRARVPRFSAEKA